jgi:hypothetical protein
MFRSLLLLLTLLFHSYSCYSQLTVESFRLLENDLDARQNYPERDQNGNLCAIIKVVTTQTEFDFDNGTLGITKTKQQKGEIWVYVPFGTKRLTIQHSLLGILRDYQIPLKIEQGRVYELKLITGTVVSSIREDMATQWVVFKCNVSDAEVYIDEQLAGTVINNEFSKELTIGKHTYRVAKDLCYPAAGMFNLTLTEKVLLTIELKENFGFIQVNTDPSGVEIIIDGNLINKVSPFQSDKLKSGMHTIIAKKTLYHEASQSVLVEDNKIATVNLLLKPTFGSINIKTIPEDSASIYIDGQSKSEKTPCLVSNIPAGTHDISIRKDWYEPKTERVRVEEGKTDEFTIELRPTFGMIKISSIPKSKIYIDGKQLSNEQWSGRMVAGIHTFESKLEKHTDAYQKLQVVVGESHEIDLKPIPQTGILKITSTPLDAVIYIDGTKIGTTPLTKRDILIGEYNLKLSKEGFGSVEKKVVITENKLSDFNETLPTGIDITIASNPDGAKVTVNETRIGTTPANVRLAPGKYDILLEKPNYQILKKSIDVADNQRSFSFDLSLDEKQINLAKLKWANTWKWGYLAVAAGALTMSAIEFATANTDYNKYKNATFDATSLHESVLKHETRAVLWAAGGAVASTMAVIYIIKSNRLKLITYYDPMNGGEVKLVCGF